VNFTTGARVALLRLLASGALKDDIMLVIFQDRKSHMLMNYAYKIDKLPLPEQDALALLVSTIHQDRG